MGSRSRVETPVDLPTGSSTRLDGTANALGVPRPLLRPVVLLLVAVLLGGVISPASPAAASDSVTVAASRSAAGSNADALSTPTRSRVATWRGTGTTVGTVLTTRFARATWVDGMRVRGAGRDLRIKDAYLQFSDGSTLLTRTTAQGDRALRFPARKVRWVRLIVASTDAGQQAVGLAGWWFHRGSADRGARARADVARTARMSASSGRVQGGAWRASRGGVQWVGLRWKRSMELSAVRISGGGAVGGTVRAGYLAFSDGSRVLVGTLEPRTGAPTTVAFTPRMTRSLRFVATETDPGARAAVHRLQAWTVGVTPPQPSVGTRSFRATGPRAKSCGGTVGSPTAQLRLLCPSNGSRVGRTANLVLSGPIGARLRVVASVPKTLTGVRTVAVAVIGDGGTARIQIPMRRLAHGPTAVRITAAGVADPLYVQLENPVGVRGRTPVPMFAKGMDLKYDEDFDDPVSVTRTGAGARYASGKPNLHGIDDFGDSIFAQPRGNNGNLGTADGYLRIRGRALGSGETDPAGYGRRSEGGLLASAHLGGSGFAAQYGYFEARMLGPAGDGTWPAFWLLSSGSLTRPGASTGEIDVVELYGHNPRGRCQTTHSWIGGQNASGVAFCRDFNDGSDFALNWHTYGVLVTPRGTTFTIDGRVTDREAPVVNDHEPFFFLLNLATGGGWPVRLSGTDDRVTLYVDRVRVWT